MILIGMFSSNYTNLTFEILHRFLGNTELNTTTINDKANNYSKNNIDILIINQKPSVSDKQQPECLCDAAVINTDDKRVVKYLLKTNTKLVTYGLNSKASITASSVLDDKIVFCVQRSFLTLQNELVVEQEFSINTDFLQLTDKAYINSYNPNLIINSFLPAVTAALLAGVKTEDILNNCRF